MAVTSDISSLADALDALRAGELVVYPTETFYALGADPFSAEALERLFDAKGRERGKPVALIAADSKMALELAETTPFYARRLADNFWPGPLTIVMPPRAGIPDALLGPDGIGVRVSPNPIARSLCRELGRPLTATSANLAGGNPPVTLADARAQLGNKVKAYLEGGTLRGGVPSTVVACAGNDVRVIREGAISENELMAAISSGALK
ncbi:MAG TPA: L-threonylcarbamoyladenylate synthase [Candidatus Binataceae bacterium]|nr:L-threonylcarbamoyladenylate synthase [Candidatus Binataceae bacterium]